MRRFFYLSADNEFLAARWLAEQASDCEAWCLHAPEAAAGALALRDAHPRIQRMIALDANAQKALPQWAEEGLKTPRIALPLMLDEFPLRYQHPLRVPDFRPRAELLRTLWTLGFREVELHHPGGSRVMPLPHHLQGFQGRHQGQRCFILGNGPSLNRIDMGRLKDEITFGSNRGYLGFEHWGFASTYWGVYDALQIEQYGLEYEQHVPEQLVKFFPLQYWTFLNMAEACPVFTDWPREQSRQFSASPERLYVGYSVVYMLLQIAAVMGCNPIILVGMDHRYHLRRRPNLTRLLRLAGRWMARTHDDRLWYQCGLAAWREFFKQRGKNTPPPPSRLWQAADAQAATHFDARYTSERKQFLAPRPKDAEADYRCALAWARERNIQILNATPDSALTVFPKVDFDSLF